MKFKKPLSIAMSAAMVMTFSPVAGAFAVGGGQGADQGAAAAIGKDDAATQTPAGEQAGEGDSLGLYNVTDKKAMTVELTQFKGAGNTAVVPAQVTLADGRSYTITSIGEKAFFGNQKITSVDIAAGVKTIGASAFEECVKLKKLQLPDGLETISDKAFFYCTRLVDVKLPATLTALGKGAFFGCSSMTSIDIPAGIKTIEKYAFSKCRRLEKVSGMEGVTQIAPRAFKQCDNLLSIPFNEGLTSIGDRAFAECISLVKANLPKSLEKLGGNAFSDCGALKEVSTSVKEIPEDAFNDCFDLKALKLEEGVERIGDTAFAAGGRLKTVNIPASATDIAPNAFSGGSVTAFKVAEGSKSYSAANGVLYNADKSTLVKYPPSKTDKSFTLPSATTELGESSFEAAYRLKTIDLSNIEKIGKDAFALGDVKTVKFSNKLTEMGEGAFQNNSALKSVSLPGSLKEVSSNSFGGCGLKTVKLGEGIEKIDSDAFSGCGSLSSISIPASATSIAGDFAADTTCVKYKVAAGSKTYKAVNGLLCSADGKTLVSVPSYCCDPKDKLITCVIPDGIETIGSGAFRAVCAAGVKFPASVTTIEKNAFDDSMLGEKVLSIPATVTTIEDNAIGYGGGDSDGDRAAGALIIGKRGSAAEKYALANDFAFATSTPKMKIAKAKLAKKGKTTTVSVKGMKSGQVKYYSSNKSVVKVDRDSGKVTAVGNGKTNVVAAMGSYYLHVNVAVGGKKATASKGNSYSGYKQVNSKKDLKSWEKKYYAANKDRSFKAAGNPAINCYTSDEYVPIKAAQGDAKYIERAKSAFGDDIEEYYEISALLKWELSRFNLPVSTELYSGISSVHAYTGAASTLDDMQASVGSELTHPVVVSTALFDSVANDFANGPYATVIHVLAPRGKTVCGYLYKFSEYPSEYEVLLANDAHFKVVDCGVRYTKLHDPEIKGGTSRHGSYERYITVQYLGDEAA